MGLADRGGASGFVGNAWGGICREWLTSLTGQRIDLGADIRGEVQDVVDIDAIPTLAAFASSRGLQNPDFLLSVRSDYGSLLVAADAKFSIETAKPRQVSAEILNSLLETPGSPVRAHVPTQGEQRDGFFVTPDYALTHLVMSGKMGILRSTVKSEQVYLLATAPDRIFQSPELRALMDALVAVDDAEIAWESDLVTALYYGRTAFACLGCRIDETKPLLGRSDVKELDDPGLLADVRHRGKRASSAWQLLQQWDRDAEEVRATRVAVRQAANIGLANRDLRSLVEAEAARLKRQPPSMNRVRRELAVWTDTELVRRFGVVYFPVTDLPGFLDAIRRAITELHRDVPQQIRAIVTASSEA